ncbi:MAG: hypothetical protein JWL77_2938 [Chthonomonadaceae bacterium]|nr:hypothetical protein [Chthonomonadaceae bacterium]
MRLSGLWAIFAVSTVLFAAGCGGGGGGGNSGNAAVNGVWSGSSTQTRAVGSTSPVQVEFFQNGNAITGTAVATGIAGTSIGNLTGTISGSQMTASVTSGVGNTATLTGVVSGTSITGTYTTTTASGSTGGTFTLTKSAGVTTPSIAGSYSGTDNPTGGASQFLTFTFTQDHDTLTYNGSTGTTTLAVTFSGTGAIIGNKVTLITPGLNGTTYFTGTFSSGTISGTTLDSQGNTGAFTVSPPQ